MMFTPCWPSAGPTGGAGVAFPAAICSFTNAETFFAIGLYLLDLIKIQFDGRSAAKNGHHHAQRGTVVVDLFYRACKVSERAVGDFDVFAAFELELWLRIFGCHFNLVDDPVNFLDTQRAGSGP